MTKQSTSGDKVHTMKTDNGSLGESFSIHDENKHKWEGQEVQVNSDPIIDPGTGETVLMRVFDFGANPENLKRDKPTKQQIFDSHIKQIQTMLWSDGLEPMKELNPLIQVSKKKEKYRIILWCRARSGVTWADSPLNLRDIIKTNGI